MWGFLCVSPFIWFLLLVCCLCNQRCCFDCFHADWVAHIFCRPGFDLEVTVPILTLKSQSRCLPHSSCDLEVTIPSILTLKSQSCFLVHCFNIAFCWVLIGYWLCVLCCWWFLFWVAGLNYRLGFAYLSCLCVGLCSMSIGWVSFCSDLLVSTSNNFYHFVNSFVPIIFCVFVGFDLFWLGSYLGPA